MPKRIAGPEEHMKTNYSETGSALDRLRADIAGQENRQLPAIIVVVDVATATPGVPIAAQ